MRLDKREEHRSECDVEQHQQQADRDGHVNRMVVADVQRSAQPGPPLHLLHSSSSGV